MPCRQYKFSILGKLSLTAVLLFIGISMVHSYWQTMNYVVTTALITGCGDGLELDYQFQAGGETIKGHAEIYEIFSRYGDRFVGRRFPVAYNPNDPGRNTLLITEKDFSRYNINFPDSLQWINDYDKYPAPIVCQ